MVKDAVLEARKLVLLHSVETVDEEPPEIAGSGHGSNIDADMVDGYHAPEIISEAATEAVTKIQWRGGGGGGVDTAAFMKKAEYDADKDGVVDNSEKLEGKTLAEVQNHPPQAHNQDASTLNAGTLDGDRLPALSTTKKGGVPATGTPSGKFLKDDETWATPTAAVSVKQVEVDFGDTVQDEKEFVVTDAGVGASSLIIAMLSGEAPTDKDQDETEMDSFNIICEPAVGQFNLFMKSLEGSVYGKFKVNYMVGA